MDTIQFRISGKEKFSIANWAQFYPEFSLRKFADLSTTERVRVREKGRLNLRKFILRVEKRDSLYIPAVEIYETANSAMELVDYELKVTFSVPKTLFETSLLEAKESQHRDLLEKLSSKLDGIGVRMALKTMDDAPVSVVHFCKNVPLPRDISMRSILKEFSHLDMGKAYDTTKITERKEKNNGEIVHLYSGTRDWTFYDKILDILRPKNKSQDKFKTDYEKELLQVYSLDNIEVFRYEYRLNRMQTIRSELNVFLKKPLKTPILVSDLFTEGLWEKVILNSWKKIIERPENQLALISTNDALDLFLHIFKKAETNNKNGHSQNQAFWSYGLARMIKELGAKTVRQECEKIWSARSDERLNEKLAIAAELARDLPLSDGILHIEQNLREFKQVTLETLSTFSVKHCKV